MVAIYGCVNVVNCEYILVQVVPVPVYGGMHVQLKSLVTPIC